MVSEMFVDLLIKIFLSWTFRHSLFCALTAMLQDYSIDIPAPTYSWIVLSVVPITAKASDVESRFSLTKAAPAFRCAASDVRSGHYDF